MDKDQFAEYINRLDAELREKIISTRKVSTFQHEYENRIFQLIIKSVSSESFEDIAKHIAFLIYAGGVSEFLHGKTTDYFNENVPRINRSIKREGQANDFMTKGQAARIKYSDEDKKEWQIKAVQYFEKNPSLSKSDVSRKLIKDLNLPEEAFESIRRSINKLGK